MYTGLPPFKHVPVALVDFFFSDYIFPLSILQRRSDFAVLVGVGEDTVQCYFREQFFSRY